MHDPPDQTSFSSDYSYFKPYLTKYWFGRWWWYRHTSRKYKLFSIKLGHFYFGRISYLRRGNGS